MTETKIADPLPLLSRYPPDRPAPPLKEYVAEARRGASLVGEFPDEERITRAEKYARWRWEGYKSGEIGSL